MNLLYHAQCKRDVLPLWPFASCMNLLYHARCKREVLLHSKMSSNGQIGPNYSNLGLKWANAGSKCMYICQTAQIVFVENRTAIRKFQNFSEFFSKRDVLLGDFLLVKWLLILLVKPPPCIVHEFTLSCMMQKGSFTT